MASSPISRLSPNSSSVVVDHRCSARQQLSDEIAIVKEDTISVFNGKSARICLVYHRSFTFYELLVFPPSSSLSPWIRFYFASSSLFDEAREEQFQTAFNEEKANYRKRHRHFQPEEVGTHLRFEMVRERICSKIEDLLIYEINQRFMSCKGAEDHVVDLFGEPVAFRSYDLFIASTLSSKPDLLVAVNTDPALQNEVHKKYQVAERLRGQLATVIQNMQTTLASNEQQLRVQIKPRAQMRDGVVRRISGMLRRSVQAVTSTASTPTSSRSASAEKANQEDSEAEPRRSLLGSVLHMARRLSLMTPNLLSNLSGKHSAPTTSTTTTSTAPAAGAPARVVSLARRRWWRAVRRVMTQRRVEINRQRIDAYELKLEQQRQQKILDKQNKKSLLQNSANKLLKISTFFSSRSKQQQQQQQQQGLQLQIDKPQNTGAAASSKGNQPGTPQSKQMRSMRGVQVAPAPSCASPQLTPAQSFSDSPSTNYSGHIAGSGSGSGQHHNKPSSNVTHSYRVSSSRGPAAQTSVNMDHYRQTVQQRRIALLQQQQAHHKTQKEEAQTDTQADTQTENLTQESESTAECSQ